MEYSMVKRDIETTLLPIAAEHGISTLSYSSLALGLLSGRMGPERTFSGDDQRRDSPRFSPANRSKVARLMAAITPVAEAHAATVAQLVIAWTAHQPGITYALCGARNPAQARENAGAGRIRLSTDDVRTIDDAVTTHLVALDA
jgi:aryl-alcohol dehydrogenase-like predicted oxidoreductase